MFGTQAKMIQYGDMWKAYKAKTPHKLIPYVY